MSNRGAGPSRPEYDCIQRFLAETCANWLGGHHWTEFLGRELRQYCQELRLYRDGINTWLAAIPRNGAQVRSVKFVLLHLYFVVFRLILF